MSASKRDKPLNAPLRTPEWIQQQTPDREIDLTEIQLPQQQPRRHFDPRRLEQLVESIQQHGIVQPLVVRPLETGGYELVAGERRYRAAQAAGLRQVPISIRNLTDTEAFQIALIENLQREDLNRIDETDGILQLLAFHLKQPIETIPSLLRQLFNAAKRTPANSTSGEAADNNVIITAQPEVNPATVRDNAQIQSAIEQVFQQVGTMTWQSFVTNRLPLLGLPPDVLESLRQGQIEYTKAKAIASVKDDAERTQLLQSAIEQDWSLLKIKEQLKSKTTAPERPGVQQRLDTAYRQTKKAKIWENPTKRQRLEALLSELESLLATPE